MKHSAKPPKASKPADPAPPTADMSCTSDLPFAARHCDLPYLDHLEDYRYELSESAPDTGFATFVAQLINRVDQMGELLAVMDDYLKLAHRGGTKDISAMVAFSRAVAVLGVARELVENGVIDADEAHENYCKSGD
ncbi:hypothetical protein [Rhodoferax sp.]|uniref:hypothetical protein n=1 Tax=Rhodoferax sp. TaxID=50421 RepID=UPI00262EE02F|nr:hypothetical protein [Rhodoferax sp.]MDD3936861.1 hypothetical protein [Rhodoferax sp.]